MALSALDVFVGIVAFSMSLGAVSARRPLRGLNALGVRNRHRRVEVIAVAFPAPATSKT